MSAEPIERHHLVALLVIVTLAALLRLPRLSSIPTDFIIDEAWAGYDAWCLVKTGRDSYGEPWPLLFRNTARLHNLDTYSMLPAVALLGPTELAVRLPIALAGVATVAGTFVLGAGVGGPVVGLAAAGLLAVSPLHVLMSRHGAVWALLPATCTLAFALLLRMARTGRGGAVAGLATGLCLYSYAPVRLLLPLLLAAFAVLFWRKLRGHVAPALCAIAVLAATATPVALYMFTDEGLDRLDTIAFKGTAGVREAVRAYVGHYTESLSPRFYFIPPSSHSLPSTQSFRSVGLLHMVELPLIVLGIGQSLRARNRAGLFFAFWVLAAPLSISIHKESPIPRLSVVVLPATAVVAAAGLGWLWDQRARRAVRGVLALTLVAGAASAARMTWDLYREFPVYSARPWSHGVGQTVAVIETLRHGFDDVVVDGRNKYVFSLILFFSRYDPALRQAEVAAMTNPRDVRRAVGPYRIGLVSELVQRPGRHLVWTMARAGRAMFPSADRLRVFRRPDGQANHALYAVDGPTSEPHPPSREGRSSTRPE